MNLSFYLTGVYGDPDFNLRSQVWEKISNLRISNNQAWMCIGDFDDILSQNEKEGLRPRENRQIENFRKFIDENGLLDMKLNGCRFTWSNNRLEGHVRERIDRMMCNAAWQLMFLDATLAAIPPIGSDHTPMILQPLQEGNRRQRRFFYEEFWEQHEDLPNIILGSWSNNPGMSITEKINNVSRDLDEWNKSTFKRADMQIHRLKKKLLKLENSSINEARMFKIRECRSQIGRLWEQEEKFWKARSRLKWLKEGDRNSRYFHATTIQRRAHNRVTRLKNVNGNWVEDQLELQGMITNHFSELFESSNPLNIEAVTRLIQPRVNRRMNEGLLSPIEEGEVKRAVFFLGPHKAPGPDGLNGLFFKHHWDVVKEDIINTVKEFFRSGQFSSSLNETVITLVPKVNTSEEVSQFRPISCCNFIYKILSKILADRMKNLMNDLISDNQSGFVKGRLIQDNIFIAHEIFHSLNSRGGKRNEILVAKLDMSKAYDRLEWVFFKRNDASFWL